MRQNNSFTLIELLIASSISIAIMITLYLSFNAGIFGYRRIEEVLTTSQVAVKVLGRINLDLRNSFAYSVSEAGFEGNKDEIVFFTLVDTFRENKTAQDYASVSYGLEGDKLLRSCRRNQDSLSNKTKTKAQILAPDLEGIFFSYGEINPEKQILEWKDAWNRTSPLPVAVKVILTIKNKVKQDKEMKQDFERIIFLPLT